MGRVSDWVIEMQEDAIRMSLSPFVNKHGYSQAEVWYETHFGTDDRDLDPQLPAQEDGFYGS